MPQRLIRAARRLSTATSTDDVFAALAAVAAPLHVLAIWSLDSMNDPTTMNRRIIYAPEFLQAKFQQEIEAGVGRYGPSPVSLWALENPAPFTMLEAVKHLKLRGTDRWGVDLLNRYGWRDGLYVPVGTWVLSYVSKDALRGQLGTEFRLVLGAASQMAVTQIQHMKRYKANVSLSVREMTVLRHLSLGHNRGAIAEQLGIHKSTVRTHVERAQEKLTAQNETHAVALAVRYRLI
jgi:DNA-binding CsgD family transcriptional regulator